MLRSAFRNVLLWGFAGIPVLFAADAVVPQAAMTPFPVAIVVDVSKPVGPLKQIWRFFGADEPNYATMSDGTKLLGELGKLGDHPVYFRTHNLLTSGDGTPSFKWGSTNAYSEDAQGKPVYDWKIVDSIFDTYMKAGVRPYVEIGFMPKELSTTPEPYQHHWKPGDNYNDIYTGWAYPPKDYAKWGELVRQWAGHAVEKYGRDTVNQWYWETWNEPNIGYWKGSAEEFFKLHDYAVSAVRTALPTARVGGPDMAGSTGAFLRAFLEHCLRGTNAATGGQGTPLDFISFHAKGSPTYMNATADAPGHVRMGISNALATVDAGFATITSFPELRNTPIVIGECDPDGCAACTGPQLGYRNVLLYGSYTAASFSRILDLADQRGVNIEGALTWAFEFEGQPYFPGQRVLATRGIDLPVLNVIRIFNHLSGTRLSVQSDGAVPLAQMVRRGVRVTPDVSALASIDGSKLCVMVWHYFDDDLPGPDAAVDLALNGLPVQNASVKVTRYLVDENHCNPFKVWQQMGSPQNPTAEQYSTLEKPGSLPWLARPNHWTSRKDRRSCRSICPARLWRFLRSNCPKRIKFPKTRAADACSFLARGRACGGFMFTPMKKPPLFILLVLSIAAIGVAQVSPTPSVTPNPKVTVPEIVRNGFDVYMRDGSNAALAIWFKFSPVSADTAAMDNIRATTEKAEHDFGKLEGWNLLKNLQMTESTAIVYTVATYQKGPLWIVFYCYRQTPTNQWTISSVALDADPVKVLPSELLAGREP